MRRGLGPAPHPHKERNLSMNMLSHTNYDAIEQMLHLIDQLPDDYDEFDPALEEFERRFAEIRLTFGNH